MKSSSVPAIAWLEASRICDKFADQWEECADKVGPRYKKHYLTLAQAADVIAERFRELTHGAKSKEKFRTAEKEMSEWRWKWLTLLWWKYLFEKPRTITSLFCRAAGHPAGPIYNRVQGLDPDWRCSNCGDYLG